MRGRVLLTGKLFVSLFIFCTLSFYSLAAEQPHDLPGLKVTDTPAEDERFDVDAARTSIQRPGTAELLMRAPGANVNFNGPLTGIAQYRGMFGNRVNVMVDGNYINSGGPNSMDPPLHYIPRPRLGKLQVIRGIAPVSSGLETIGGTVIAESRRGEFSSDEKFDINGYVDGGGQSVDNGYFMGGVISAANDQHRFQVGGSREDGDDTKFGSGTIASSAYERNSFDVGYGYRVDSQEAGLSYFGNETENTGTPALPMDIVFFDTDIFRGDYEASFGDTQVQTKVSYHKVDHQMNNFGQRPPPPDPNRFRLSNADSKAWYYSASASRAFGPGKLTVGADGNPANHNATIFNPNNAAFFVQNFNDVDRDRFGFFSEWRGWFSKSWGGELGLRYTRVEMNAGTVDGTPAQTSAGPRVLRDRFNGADRDKNDNNLDAVAKLLYQFEPGLTAELGFGRKTRSPWYQERYLWLPLQATGGLADGNNYVGNIDLEPEVSYQYELGLNWRNERFYLAPRGFYRRVDDYIQGTPATDPVVIAVSTANGDLTPLQFNNVDAELFGADLEWGISLAKDWHLDGVLSYVRGKRRDIGDDIFRVAPLNGTVALTYEQSRWFATVEGILYDRQDKVSVTNQETQSAGYGLLNVLGQYTLMEGAQATATLKAYVNNVLDKTYHPHLNGLNRVRNSDVAVGQRVPGPGRNFLARLDVEF